MRVDPINPEVLERYVTRSLKLSMLEVKPEKRPQFYSDFEKGISFMKKIDKVDIKANLEPLHNVLDFYRPGFSKLRADVPQNNLQRDFTLTLGTPEDHML